MRAPHAELLSPPPSVPARPPSRSSTSARWNSIFPRTSSKAARKIAMAHGWPGGAAAGASALLRTQEVSRRDFPSIGSTFQRSHPSPRALSVACASCARTEKGDGKLRSSARHPRRRRRETLDRWCDRCHGRREPHTRVRRAINHPGAFGGARSEV